MPRSRTANLEQRGGHVPAQGRCVLAVVWMRSTVCGIVLSVIAGCRAQLAASAARLPAAAPAAGRDTAPPPRMPVTYSQGPYASASAPRGELVGLVVSDSTGQGIARAQIVGPRPFGAQTDSAGRFRMRLLRQPADTFTVTVRAIGHRVLRVPARLQPDSGYFVVFALSPEQIRLSCIQVGMRTSPAVVVQVYDAGAGVPLRGVVTLAVRDRAFRDRATVEMPTVGGGHVIAAAPGRAGEYSVTVESEGYHPWHGRVKAQPCGTDVESGVLIAWLVPR